MEDEPFRLIAAPASRSARHAARVRDERERCDRVARRQADYQAWRARAYLITNGPELVDVADPEEGATLADVVNVLAARVQAARDARSPAARWWDRDLAVWQAGRLLATVRPAGGGMPVTVTVFDHPL